MSLRLNPRPGWLPHLLRPQLLDQRMDGGSPKSGCGFSRIRVPVIRLKPKPLSPPAASSEPRSRRPRRRRGDVRLRVTLDINPCGGEPDSAELFAILFVTSNLLVGALIENDRIRLVPVTVQEQHLVGITIPLSGEEGRFVPPSHWSE